VARGALHRLGVRALSTVLVTYGGYALEDPECGGALQASGLELRVSPRERHRSADEMVELLDGAVAAIADADLYDAEVLRRSPGLRVIARTGVGLDMIDLDAAAQAGVYVTTTPEVNNETVADHALALILAAQRSLLEQDAIVRGGGWRSFAVGRGQLHGATVGIVGYGAIGKAVARRLRGFGVRILAYDPFVTEAQDGVTLTALDDLLAQSDIVTVHAPLSDQTRGLLDARAFGLMRPGATIVNTARGPVIDETALVQALQEGRLAAAGLDVFEREPPAESPLLEMRNVVLSPHVGGISDASNLAMSRLATENVLAVLAGRTPPTAVTSPR
jgi:phosphoglycerate dehydrogenase-like enzyme